MAMSQSYVEFEHDGSLYSDEVVVCPYCRHEHRPCDSEGALYDEATTEYECEDCGEEFVVNVEVSFSWSTKKGKTDG